MNTHQGSFHCEHKHRLRLSHWEMRTQIISTPSQNGTGDLASTPAGTDIKNFNCCCSYDFYIFPDHCGPHPYPYTIKAQYLMQSILVEISSSRTSTSSLTLPFNRKILETHIKSQTLDISTSVTSWTRIHVFPNVTKRKEDCNTIRGTRAIQRCSKIEIFWICLNTYIQILYIIPDFF